MPAAEDHGLGRGAPQEGQILKKETPIEEYNAKPLAKDD